MNLETAIILPTFNAKNTIIMMIESILTNTHNSLVIVVDDSSPDKTSHLIRSHFRKNSQVRLIIRKEKGGRGSAVIRGFQEGLKIPSIRYFIEMDADLCHDPRFINDMIRASRKADIIIASRYLKKSKNINWKLKRKLFSLFVSSFLRMFLKVPITDYTNGFRCYKRIVIESTDFRQIKSKGFIVLSEIAYQIYKLGFQFKEISFTFQLYELNESNLKFSEIREAITTIIRLRLTGFR